MKQLLIYFYQRILLQNNWTIKIPQLFSRGRILSQPTLSTRTNLNFTSVQSNERYPICKEIHAWTKIERRGVHVSGGWTGEGKVLWVQGVAGA